MDDPIHFHGILEDAMTNGDLLHRKKQAYDMKAFMLENEVVDSRLIEKSSGVLWKSWIMWIRGFFCTMNKSFELHEIPKACYLSHLDSLLKSLRQEDPLSPFLLIIVMEALNCLAVLQKEVWEREQTAFLLRFLCWWYISNLWHRHG